MACFKDRKKQQRKVNKIVKKINQRMKNDILWRGRFQLKQIKDAYKPYPREENAPDWGDYWVKINFIDKKTLKQESYWVPYVDNFFTGRLYVRLNKFIVDDCKVWDENPSPLKQTEVYY